MHKRVICRGATLTHEALTATPFGCASKAKAKAKPRQRGPKSKLDVFLKCLAKALTEIEAVATFTKDLAVKNGDKATPFIQTLETQREDINRWYELLRCETTQSDPNQAAADDVSRNGSSNVCPSDKARHRGSR
jgi:hypothetical protein